MSEKAKAIHNAYCDYEIAKANHRHGSIQSGQKLKLKAVSKHTT